MTKSDRKSLYNSSNDFMGMLNRKMTEGMNTSLAGQINFDDDDVLLLQVKQKLSKAEIYNKVVSSAEANNCSIDYYTIYEYNEAGVQTGSTTYNADGTVRQ